MPILSAQERVGTTVLGKYRLDRILGEGGMGVVYEGTHLRLGAQVAVKFLRPQYSEDHEVVQRFIREAQSAARLRHPNVVDVRDIEVAEDGALFMVLELLSGESLAAYLDRAGRLDPAHALELLLPALDAVATAHAAGIVHRDLKPENLFLAQAPNGATLTKVLDFGIAKLAHAGGPSSTGTGAVIGTPAYMAPEQAMGRKEVGPPADVWSMAVVLYQCLTGAYPFDFEPGASATAVVVTIVTTAAVPIASRRADLPPALASAIDAALAKDPALRTGDIRTFVDALRAGTGMAPIPARVSLHPRADATPAPILAGGPAQTTTPFVTSTSATTFEAAVQRGRLRRPVLIAAAAVLAIALVGGIVLTFGAGDGASTPSVAAAPPPSLTATAPSSALGSETTHVESIHVTIAVTPADAELTLDGSPIAPGILELPRDGATHRLVAHASGREDETRDVVADGDQTVTLALAARRRRPRGGTSASTPTTPATTATSPPPSSSAPDPGRSGRLRTW